MSIFNKKQDLIMKQLDYNKPFIVLNLKTYKEATGDNALRLARICEKVQEKTKLNIIICPQAIDIRNIALNVKIPIFAQHIDNKPVGKSTGNIVPENLMDINVHGSLLNHSEMQLDIKMIEKTVLKLKELDMRSIVCAKDNIVAKKFASFKIVKPDFIAVEPPELIGTEKSISTSRPEIIEKSVNACKGVNVLVGAGVKDNNDVKIALKYGAKGVLLSSHFVMSKDPEKFLMDLLHGI